MNGYAINAVQFIIKSFDKLVTFMIESRVLTNTAFFFYIHQYLAYNFAIPISKLYAKNEK